MRNQIKRLIKQAEDDLNTAKDLLEDEKYYASVFFSQQCVEKSLKALYIKEKKESTGKTHSLIYLGKQTTLPKKHYTFLRNLTPEFVLTRYPDAAEELPSELYDEETASKYLEKTEEVLKWIQNKIE